MKLFIAIVLFATLASAIPPDVSVSFGFAGGDWVGNVNCIFYNANDCELSAHVNGRRLDAATHNANEDVLVSCLSSRPSLDLVIHNFSYVDIGDYTCLADVPQDHASIWLSAAPVIELSSPIVHGQPVTLVCNAPRGSPLYWILPGPQENHQSAVITDSTNGQNASSTLTFTEQEADHFTAYQCCIGLAANQPPSSSCSSFTVVDSEVSGYVKTTADFQGLQFFFTAEVHSTPLVDDRSVVWQSCLTSEICTDLSTINYDVENHPESYSLNSNMQIFDDGVALLYKFTINTTDDSAQYTASFPVSRGDTFPTLTPEPTTIYYNQVDGTTTAVVKYTVTASPPPTITWQKQYTRKESLGSETIVTGGHYGVSVTQISSTEWEATLAISPYDPTVDDAVYTLVAENSLGTATYNADTTVGPNYLTLTRNLNSTGYNFNCEFENFPFPSIYELNVVSPYTNSYSVVSTQTDPQYARTTINADVTIDAQNTYFYFTCWAFNPYGSTSARSQTIAVTV